MATAKIDAAGMRRLENNIELLKKCPHTKEAKKIFHRYGLVVRKWARYFAPYDPKRKKGEHLRDAILVSDGPLAFTDCLVTVRYKRPGAPHAHLQEFGTVRMAAHPFMRPAASTAAAEVGDGMKRDILELIKATPR